MVKKIKSDIVLLAQKHKQKSRILCRDPKWCKWTECFAWIVCLIRKKKMVLKWSFSSRFLLNVISSRDTIKMSFTWSTSHTIVFYTSFQTCKPINGFKISSMHIIYIFDKLARNWFLKVRIYTLGWFNFYTSIHRYYNKIPNIKLSTFY